MAHWVGLAADWLRPEYDAIRTGVLADGYLQVDETPVAYLEPRHGSTRQGYLWTYARPGGDVLFDWQTGRGGWCRAPKSGAARRSKKARSLPLRRREPKNVDLVAI